MQKLEELMHQVILPETMAGRIRVVGILLAEIAAIEQSEGREFWYNWSPHVTWFYYRQYTDLWDNLGESEKLENGLDGYINLDLKSTIKDITYLITQLKEAHG